MKFADIHAHLEDERFARDKSQHNNDGKSRDKRFSKDLAEVIKRAEQQGIKLIINSGTSKKRNRETLELSKKFPLIKCSFGWYPVGNSPENLDEEIKWIEEHNNECFCIGEIGLDYNEEKENAEKQKEMFVKMIRLAKKLDKPIVVHSRKAESEAIEILEKENASKVVMHCFSGSKSLIKRARENGWFFSVPAVIKRLQHFQTLVALVDIKQLLTETDAPYLAPVAGERSEPKDVVGTIEEIAKIKNLPKEKVAEQIWKNTEKLFFG